MTLPPTIDAVSDVAIDEGGTVNVGIQVNDDFNPAATIVIYDKSEPLGNNTPYTPALVVDPADYTFTDNGAGSYTLNWPTSVGDGRSYEARVIANDGSNADVVEAFTINVAQDITPGVILARTFASPLPHYGNSPSGSPGQDFSVSIEGAGNIGWIDNNDFVEYLIDVPSGGNYDIRVNASNGSGGTNTFNILVDNGGGFVPIGSITVPANGWGSFANYTDLVTFVSSGLQTLRFEFSGGTNINEFEFTENNSNAAPLVLITAPENNFAAEQGTNITFTGSATDPEEGDLSSNLSWTSDIDNAIGSGASFSTSGLSIGTHQITAEVTDSDGTDPQTGSATITVIIGPAAPNCDVAFRVNAGGPLYASASGNFEADQSAANAGGTAQTGTPSSYVDTTPPNTDTTFGATTPLVSNTTGYPDYLFQTERWSEDPQMNWTFPTGNGTFEVSILFNENWGGEGGSPRVFDVNVEGALQLDDYRPSVDGTQINVAKVETFEVTVIDGELNIDFIQGTQNPAVKGFSICAVDAAPVVSIQAPADNATVTRGQDVTLTGLAIDEEDGDISSLIEWSSDQQVIPTPVNGIGASITAQFITPGVHTLTASVTDTDNKTGTASITVNVPGPEVAFAAPSEGATISCTSVDVDLNTTGVLFGNQDHFHFFINPADPNNLDPNKRISTVGSSDTSFTFDENSGAQAFDGNGNGIVPGVNKIIVIVADSNHTEYGNSEAKATLNFSVAVPSIDNIAATDPTDCNVDDGQIIVTATGTNLEYSINGVDFQASNTFTDLPADNYTITAREVGNEDCLVTDSVELTAPVAPVITNVAGTDPSDCGVDDGQIVITATGLNIEYSIDGNNFQTGNTFNDLPGGNYTITVREVAANSCVATDNITLNAPVAPSITNVAGTDPSDCGVDDGQIVVTATGTNLEYSINGVDFQAGNTFTDLPSANYTVTVREADATSCVATDNVTLTAPAAPVITSAAGTDPSDCGTNDGQIVVTATGTNLEYSIDNVNFQTSNTFTGLGGGNFTVTVREVDANSCVATDNVLLTAPVVPVISDVSVTDPTDCDAADGTIVVSATGTDLEYSIDGSNFQASNTFTALVEGPYTVTVREASANNCVASDSASLTAPQAPVDHLC